MPQKQAGLQRPPDLPATVAARLPPCQDFLQCAAVLIFLKKLSLSHQ